MSDLQGIAVRHAKNGRQAPLQSRPFDFDVETIRNATPQEWAAATSVLQDRAPDLLECIGEPPC